MRWIKGQSGNPNGRASEKAFAATVRAVGNETDKKTKRRKLYEVVRQLYDQAIEGQAWAIGMIADRLDGKPEQSVDVTTRRITAAELPDDTIADIIAGRLDGGAGAGTVSPESDPPVTH